MTDLLIFGFGYTAQRLAADRRAAGWTVTGTGRNGTLRFEDAETIARAIATSTHILSSVPPADDADPVLAAYGDLLARHRGWLGYLSSTGVYGDAGGAWVDESAAVGRGRRTARAAADAAWLALGARVLRLPGIYGPGRSALDRVREGRAHRVDLPEQVFSRVHVDDIVGGIVAAFDGPPGAYNLADDLPGPQNDVIDYACRLLGLPPLPLVGIETLAPPARAFYAENRRVANGKAKRLLGWRPRFSDYRAGLCAISATTSPTSVSAAPSAAPIDQA